jgi:hypothetical protein
VVKLAAIALGYAVLAPAVTAQTTSASDTLTPTMIATATATAALTATVIPTPSTTPVVTVPGGPGLLTKMKAAVIRLDSFHEVKDATGTLPSRRLASHGTIDESLRTDRLRARYLDTWTDTTKHPPTVSKSKGELIVVGKREASRNGTHGRWTCFVASTGTFAGTGNRIVSSRTVGATSVHGVAVWHVQSNEKNTVGSEKVDYFIAQDDDRLIRMMEVLTHVPANGVTHDTATSDFSLYGESVSVQFPTACS